MKKIFLMVLLFVSAAMGNTYNSRCMMTTNDIEKYGKSMEFRLSICKDKDSKSCELIVETDSFKSEAGKKAFSANLHFKFTKVQIDTIIKNKTWDEEKARIEYGVVANGKYKPNGSSNLLVFLEHASRSSTFNSQVSSDEKTGLITAQSCEVIDITN